MLSSRPRFAVNLLFFLNGWINAHWVARIPDMKQLLNVGEATLGIALFAAAIGALIAQPIAGWLVNRIGSGRVTLYLALWLCAAVALLGQAWSLPTLMLALALHGAGVGGMDVAMNVQAANVERAGGKPIMTSFHGVWSIGSLVGALLGGLIAGAGLGLPVHLPLVGAVSALLVLLAVTGLVIADPAHAPADPARPSGARISPALIGMGVMAFCILCAEGAVADWSTLYMRDTLGEPVARATLAFAFFSGAMALGRFGGDALVQRFGAARILRGSGALVLFGMLIVLAGSVSPWPVPLSIIGFIVTGGGLSCVFPQILSLASRMPGMGAGTGIAAMATAGYTGFLVGPPLIGVVAEAVTLRWALGLIAVFGAVVWVLAVRTTPTRAA